MHSYIISLETIGYFKKEKCMLSVCELNSGCAERKIWIYARV